MAGIIEFFEGQNILVTGATGFLGKVLLEKLMRSCPDVGNIYVLIRPKKDKEPRERVKDIISLPLFDIIRRERPETFSKIVPLAGDCAELGLGLSSNDRQILEQTVSVVFHAAANVRFDDPLKSAVLLNTRGTREIMLIVRNMKNLKVFVHVSTTYCNCDRPIVEEVIYPPHANWKDIISIVEHVDERTLDILTRKILHNLPNTYTFTKSLAEHVVKDLGENLPVAIFRPSIVVSSLEEPFPGWIDNFNGPVGLMIAGGKGVLRTTFSDPDAVSDYMPVDVCIQLMLLVAWYEAVCSSPSISETSQPSVYNSAAHKFNVIKLGELIDTALKLTAQIPFDGVIWKPSVIVTKCQAWYYLNVIFKHLLPGLLVDGLLILGGKKPQLVRLHRRIYVANMELSYFTTKSWVFPNHKLMCVRTKVPACDNKHIKLDGLENIDTETFLKNAMWGSKVYLLKERTDDLSGARRHYRRMYWLDKSLRFVVVMLLLWFGYQSTLLQSTFSGIFTSSVFS